MRGKEDNVNNNSSIHSNSLGKHRRPKRANANLLLEGTSTPTSRSTQFIPIWHVNVCAQAFTHTAPVLQLSLTKSCKVIYLTSLLFLHLLRPDLHLLLHFSCIYSLERTKCKRWTSIRDWERVIEQPEYDCDFLMLNDWPSVCLRYCKTGTKPPKTGTSTQSHIRCRSNWETSALSDSAEQWCISEFFTFAWQPTANRLPNSLSLGGGWQEPQIGAAQWFISSSVCMSMRWKFHGTLM